MPDLAFYCKAGDGPLPWVTFAVSTWLGEAWRQRRTAFDNVSYVNPANGFRLRVDITLRYQMPSDNSLCFLSERSELSSERSELPCLSRGAGSTCLVHGAWSHSGLAQLKGELMFAEGRTGPKVWSSEARLACWLTGCYSLGPERWTYRRSLALGAPATPQVQLCMDRIVSPKMQQNFNLL